MFKLNMVPINSFIYKLIIIFSCYQTDFFAMVFMKTCYCLVKLIDILTIIGLIVTCFVAKSNIKMKLLSNIVQ